MCSAVSEEVVHRIYVVGDIHGRSDCLQDVHQKIIIDFGSKSEAAKIVYLGDYIDRGPDSKGVIEELLKLRGRVRQIFLLGNHEYAMRLFMCGGLSFSTWRQWGGDFTLKSYGADSSVLKEKDKKIRDWININVPVSHLEFISDLKIYHREAGHIFVHAGLRPNVDLESQEVEDLVMIRDDFILNSLSVEESVVYGHTIHKRPSIVDRKIGIDTGAYKTGRLTALVIEGMNYRFIEGKLDDQGVKI